MFLCGYVFFMMQFSRLLLIYLEFRKNQEKISKNAYIYPNIFLKTHLLIFGILIY